MPKVSDFYPPERPTHSPFFSKALARSLLLTTAADSTTVFCVEERAEKKLL